MDFELPAEITATLAELDAFIEAEIKPLEQADAEGAEGQRPQAEGVVIDGAAQARGGLGGDAGGRVLHREHERSRQQSQQDRQGDRGVG